MTWYFPNRLYVETSDYCNRSCSYCPIQRDRPPGPARRLDLDLFRRLLEEVRAADVQDVQISLQWIDEPLSNPDFFAYAELGRAVLPDARWLLQTNGDHLKDDSFADMQRLFDAVAINFYDERPYERFVAREYDYVPAQFKRRLQSPGKLRRGFGFEDRTDEAIVHLNRKFVDDDWVEHHDAVQVADHRRCLRPWVQAAVAFDGTVYVCCRDNLREHPVGSLRDGSLFAAFNSPAAQALRARMEAGRRRDIAMCRTCPNAFTNRFDALDETRAERLSGAAPLPPRAAPTHVPYGRYDYATARAWAKRLGHVALPGLEPRRYEYVVGLTPELLRALVDTLTAALGEALVVVWVTGSRVMTRARLFEVDPTPFEDPDDPLEVGAKGRLRIFGPDPALASDLDLKVFVDEAALDEARCEALAPTLGAALEGLDDTLPLSGHASPRLHLHRVPGALSAADAFRLYNRRRFATLGRGVLSTEYVQLVHDPRRPDATADPFAAVRAVLKSAGTASRPGGAGRWVPAAPGPGTRARFRGSWAGLTYHQLVMALVDFPDLEPPGVRVDEAGRVVEGLIAVHAAAEAGRERVWAEGTPSGSAGAAESAG